MIKIIVFTNDRSKIDKFPQRAGVNFQHVDFNTSKLDDLLLIAKYKILHFPVSLVIDNMNRVLLRMRGIISEPFIDDLFVK